MVQIPVSGASPYYPKIPPGMPVYGGPGGTYGYPVQGINIGGPTGVYSPGAKIAPGTAGQFGGAGIPAQKTAPAAGGGAKAPAKKPLTYDYSGDPALLAARKAWDERLANMQAQTLAEQKRMLLAFGSRELAAAILGNQGDEAFLSSVAQNPYSFLRETENTYEGPQGLRWQMNEGLNQENLFWSGHRINRMLPELSREKEGAIYTEDQAVRAALTKLTDALTNFKTERSTALAAAESEAANRAMQIALATGGGGIPGGGSADQAAAAAAVTPAVYSNPLSSPAYVRYQLGLR